MANITKIIGIAVSDYKSDRISKEHYISILQESVDNGDIFLEDNRAYIGECVLPLIFNGTIKATPSQIERLDRLSIEYKELCIAHSKPTCKASILAMILLAITSMALSWWFFCKSDSLPWIKFPLTLSLTTILSAYVVVFISHRAESMRGDGHIFGILFVYGAWIFPLYYLAVFPFDKIYLETYQLAMFSMVHSIIVLFIYLDAMNTIRYVKSKAAVDCLREEYNKRHLSL